MVTSVIATLNQIAGNSADRGGAMAVEETGAVVFPAQRILGYRGEEASSL